MFPRCVSLCVLGNVRYHVSDATRSSQLNLRIRVYHLANMRISKDTISSPLEAGMSLVESQKLPPRLADALGYASNRLVRKRLHLTLIVSRSQCSESGDAAKETPTISSPPSTTSLFPRNIRWPSRAGSLRSMASTSTISSTYSSQAPLSPPHTPCTPMTPSSPRVANTNEYGISLLHATTLSEKASRVLEETIAKTSRKFRLCDGWLSPPSASNTLTNEAIRHSLEQNEVIYSNEGFTLLSLDRVYTCKLAISKYSVSQDQYKNTHLVDAVNELRLLVLVHNGRRISDTFLFGAYKDISVSSMEMRAVNSAYRQRFQTDGIVMAPEPPTRPLPSFAARMANNPLQNTIQARGPGIQLSIPGTSESEHPRTTQMPITKLKIPGVEERDIEIGETAKSPGFQGGPPSPSTIVRLSQWLPRRSRGGPMTPNDYADVTPITRSEWGHFMGGREGGNFAAIQTF